MLEKVLREGGREYRFLGLREREGSRLLRLLTLELGRR